MTAWAVAIGQERYAAERLFHHDQLELAAAEEQPAWSGAGPAVGDDALVVLAGRPARIVALGRITATGAGQDVDPDDPQSEPEASPLVVRYTRRIFDAPVPARGLVLAGPVSPVARDLYLELAGRVGPVPDRAGWMVSLDLPVEAPSAAEAVRVFWSYVMELGPRELPAFVSPAGDELAMQAFVLGEEASQDPEEDD
ncbi:MAG TPA: hypothetical protein VGD43_01030 [Micromonospora sp.]